MGTTTTAMTSRREPELLGQTVVAIGGSARIGLETARRARTEGADVILVGRNPERLEDAAREVGDSACSRCLSQGIGAALAGGYGRAGYAVVGTARSTFAPGDDGDVVTVAGDIADRRTAHRVVDRALDRFGPDRHPDQQRRDLCRQAVRRCDPVPRTGRVRHRRNPSCRRRARGRGLIVARVVICRG